ncbi:hypothetical protein HUJ04_012432 [Dendroctonus ponderosae]|nr:hypothetical protein HUJ04_012432 [Dendroctonus ponderosae]KAH1029638.1 hypothetical protein HUJ05_002837 [Dendroctonus ponderosae]
MQQDKKAVPQYQSSSHCAKCTARCALQIVPSFDTPICSTALQQRPLLLKSAISDLSCRQAEHPKTAGDRRKTYKHASALRKYKQIVSAFTKLSSGLLAICFAGFVCLIFATFLHPAIYSSLSTIFIELCYFVLVKDT